MDDDPLVCYGEMGVFMHLLGVACDTPPAPPEKGLRPPFRHYLSCCVSIPLMLLLYGSDSVLVRATLCQGSRA